MAALRPTLMVLALLLVGGDVAVASDDAYVVIYKKTGVEGVPAKRVDPETDARERTIGFQSRHRYKRALPGFAARLSAAEVERLRRDPAIAIVERDREVRAAAMTPVATGEAVPTGVARIGAARAGSVYEASSTSIAVLDTGADLTHPDLDVHSGANCVGTGVAQDDNGHGTGVAGIIGARNTGSGVVGVAPGSRMYAVKVLDANGTGLVSQVICGIEWVTANAAALNIKVANLSLSVVGSGGSCSNEALHSAICAATNAGVLYVVAAGNEGLPFDGYPPIDPAVFPEVLTVSAMSDSDSVPGAVGGAASCTVSGVQFSEPDDSFASYSNYASTDSDAAHTIAAPGMCIWTTTLGHGHAFEAGTSFSAPHAAGVAALCLGQGGAAGPCAGLTPAETIRKLRTDAALFGSDGYGFTGDPATPVGGYFGDLVSAERSTRPLPPSQPPQSRAALPSPPPAKPEKRLARRCLVPKLGGLTRRQARRKLVRGGCRYRWRGRGRRVTSTAPKAGKRTDQRVTVRFAGGRTRRDR